MGAWIEICKPFGLIPIDLVAPLVGAWIEILLTELARAARIMSLPLWERGLKYWMWTVLSPLKFVAPLVGAWIEIYL